MATVSDSDFPIAFPTASVAGELAGGPKNHLREALRILKREWIEAKMGKGQSWATKVFNNESGVMLDDIPNLVMVCGFKIVPGDKAVLDPAIAHAYETLARHTLKTRTLIEE